MLFNTFISWLESQFSICDWLPDEKVPMEIKEDIIIFEV